MSNEYKIATILDMARIPEEELPSFIQELPSILDTLRPLCTVVDSLGMPDSLLLEQAIWKNDGKTEKTVTLKTITSKDHDS